MKLIKVKTKANHVSSYFLPHFWLLIFIIISGIFFNFGQLASPYFQGILIDAINAKENNNKIIIILLIYLFSICFFQIFRFFKRYLIRILAAIVSSNMRYSLFNSYLNLPLEEIKTRGIGPFLTNAIYDINNTSEGLRKLITEIFDTILFIVFYVIYLSFFDYIMTLYALIPVFISIVFTFIMRKKIYKCSSKVKQASSNISTFNYDYFENAITYQLYGRNNDLIKTYDNYLTDYEKNSFKTNLLTDTLLPLAKIIALIGLIPIFCFGLKHIILSDAISLRIPYILDKNWSLGLFTTYLTSFIILASKASRTAKLFSSIQIGLSSWNRIKGQFKNYQEFKEKVALNKTDELIIKNVSIFVNNSCIIKDFNLTAKKNQMIGITGPIASGKSLLGKVFLKEINYQGSINLFGKELKNYSQEEISGNITYMGHENQLFTKSIEENLLFDEKKNILPFLKKVDFIKDLQKMDNKEKTIIGNRGLRLSTGQQERLSLARTIINKKGLVILDDPFANIDIKTEEKIISNIKDDFKGSLLILISHRLSSFKELNQVVILNGDSTYEVSTHNELLKNNKNYQLLYSLQNKEQNS